MQVTQLFVHPVKSLRGVQVRSAEVDKHGFKNDRIYMLAIPTEEPGRVSMLTQRQYPKMALIDCEIHDRCLIVKPRDKNIELKLPLGDGIKLMACKCPTVDINIWGSDATAYDVGEASGFKQFWAQTMDEYPDATLLVPQEEGRRDASNLVFPEHVEDLDRPVETSFQDLVPGHVLGTASLEELNERLERETNGEMYEITARNFRPNIVVKTSKPYEEDFWHKFKTGEVTWFVHKLCPRCPIPTINPETGIPSKLKQPTKSMLNYRRVDPAAKEHCFGISCINKESSGVIHVGDQVQVLETFERY